MPIPTELVGSLPRPEKIKRLEQTGETSVTDGEQRESSFASRGA